MKKHAEMIKIWAEQDIPVEAQNLISERWFVTEPSWDGLIDYRFAWPEDADGQPIEVDAEYEHDGHTMKAVLVDQQSARIIDGDYVTTFRTITEKWHKVAKPVVRPWTFEDDLFGVKIISDDECWKGMITEQMLSQVKCGDSLITYKELLEDNVQLNGNPCGVVK